MTATMTKITQAIAGQLNGGVHQLAARVYYADTDFSGFVYHGRYLEFFERGRTDFLRLKNVHHTELAEGALGGEPIVWVVRRMEIDFKAPAKIDDLLLIQTEVESIRAARVFMKQTISRGDMLLASARVEAVMITTEGRPKRIPAEWIDSFTSKT